MAENTPPKSPPGKAPARKAAPPVKTAPKAEPVPVVSAAPSPPVKASPPPEPVKEETAAAPVVEIVEHTAALAKEAVAEPIEAIVETAPEPENIKPETITEPIPAAATEEGTTIMTDAIETTKKVAAEAKEKFQAAFGEFNEKAKVAVEKSSKILEEVNEITKGNVEAVVESGKIAAKGAEALGQEAAEYSRKSFEKATATMKSFASVKSPTEFFQLQSEFFASAFDNLASEASKSSEAMLKLAGDVVQPLSTRFSVVSEKVKSFTL